MAVSNNPIRGLLDLLSLVEIWRLFVQFDFFGGLGGTCRY